MRKLVALPVLSADALSSVAYGPEAMLAVLVLAGSNALSVSLPIGAAIVFLMFAVGVSYRQTIRAYPHGGGSYIVASDNLGRTSGLVAAAGLMTDYVLTVAVSVAAGLAAITSAIPSLRPEVVPIGVIHHHSLVACRRRTHSSCRTKLPPDYTPCDRGHRRTRCPARVARFCLGVDGDDRDRSDLQRGSGI